MSYQVLARKHRPQTFDDLFGQEAVAQTLKNALSSKKLAHAYLFFGARGTGKTTTARILAKALNCAKGPTPEPCLKCAQCVDIAEGKDLDVLEIDAATHTQVDKVREVIIETVALAPARDRYKVFIIDEAHMLSTSAFNALLKTLEEPPAHVVFMLATTEQHKIPATIFSRCQRYRFKLQGVPVIVDYLKKVAKLEKADAEPKALELIARAAEGSMRDAVSLLDQAIAFADGPLKEAGVRELLGQLPEELLRDIAKAVIARDAQALSDAFASAVEEGQDPAGLLRELRGFFHRMYTYRLGLGELEKSWSTIADGAEPNALAFAVRRLAKGVEELRNTDQVRLSVELTLFGLIETPHDLREWVARLEAMEQRLASGAPAPEIGPSPALRATSPVGRGSQKEAPPAAASPHQTGSPSPSGRGPAAGRGEGTSSSPDFKAVWPRVVAAIQAQRPVTGDALAAAQAEFSGNAIRLAFVSNFKLNKVQGDLAFVQEAFKAITGVQPAIELRQDRDASATPLAPVAGQTPDEAIEEQEEQKPKKESKWKPVEANDPLKSQAGAALKVFGGKLYKPKE